jgi:hypothetical protein
VEWPTLEQRTVVWGTILTDPDAKGALTRLRRDGFAIDHLMPDDSGHLCWADYISAIPFFPNRPSRRQLHKAKALRKHLPLVTVLRQLIAKSSEPFCEIRRNTKKGIFVGLDPKLAHELAAAADLVEEFLTWDWYTRDRNNRNSVIAALRWKIRQSTGTPHDRELGTLIYAAFRAAGIKEDFYLDATTLDRIEKLDKEGRIKATYRLNILSGLERVPDPGRSLSTRFRKNRKKHV